MPTPKKKSKTNTKKKAPPVSPFSTGGGGVCLEHRVGALFLSHLLLKTAPPGASDFEVAELKWQRRNIDDIPLDDLVVRLHVPHAKDESAFITLQLKHDMSWGTSPNNTTFQAVMRACWDTFRDPARGQFDRFGVVVGVEKADYKTYREVINTAEKCANGKDFVRVVEKGGIKGKNFIALIRSVLDSFLVADESADALSDEQLWKFLRQFCLLRFDLMESESLHLVQCCNNLQLGIPLASPTRAREVWKELVSIAAESNKAAGSCDRKLLQEKLARYLPKEADAPVVAASPETSTAVTMEGIAALLAQHGNLAQEGSPTIKVVDDSNTLSPRRIEEERIDAKVDAAREQIKAGHNRAARQTLEDLQAEQSLSARLQFRIKANLGVCAWALGEDAQAVELCRAAYHQEPDNPNAMVIGAQAELIDDKPAEAIALCECALKLEPRSTDAALIYIQALIMAGFHNKLEAWLEQEKWVTDEAACAPPLARLDYENGDIDAAIKRLERFEKEPNGETETAFHLAWLFLLRGHSVWKRIPFLSWKLPAQLKRDFTRCAELYHKVIEAEKEAEDSRQKVVCLCNRAVALMFLSRDAEASENLQQAARLKPQDASVWVNIGWMHFKNNEFEAGLEAHEKARALLDAAEIGHGKESREGGERWENVRGLVVAYSRTNNWDKLRAHLAQLMLWDGHALIDENGVPLEAPAFTHDFCGVVWSWLEALDESTRQDQVPMQEPTQSLSPQQAGILDWLEAKFPDHPEVVALRGSFAWFKRRFLKAIKLMRRAVELSTEGASDHPTLILAEALFQLGRYGVSAKLFKVTVSEALPTGHREHYALALLRSGNLVEAQSLAVRVRQLEPKGEKKHAPAVPLFSEIEAECADYIGDLETALRLRRELMEVEPHRSDHALEVALLEFKMGNRAKAQAVLQTTHLIAPETNPELSMRFAFAKAELRLAGALELGYKVWRAHPHKDWLQISYLTLFQRVTTESDPLLRPEVVGTDCAITFKTVGAKRSERTRILVQADGKTELREAEEDISSARIQALVGKRVGDIVTIGRQWDEDIQVEITEIRHKFVYAFQKVFRRVERGDVQEDSFKVENVGTEGNMEEWKKTMTKRLLKSRRGWEELANIYRRQPIPLSAIALMKDRFCLELWSDIASIGGRFYSSDGDIGQILRDTYDLIGHSDLVLDETALGCICLLNLESEVTKLFPRLLVPQIVREQLRFYFQREIQSSASKGYLSHDGQGLRYVEVSTEVSEQRCNFIKQIIRFVDRHCEVVPVTMLLQAPHWVQVLGKGAVAAVLLAKERQIPLWSDDARLRGFGADRYRVKSTYYFPVFRRLRNRGWNAETMQSALCRLSVHGYSHVLISPEILLWRLKQDSFKLNGETRALLFRAFNGRDVNLDWAATNLAGLIHILWSQKPRLLDSQYRSILKDALESYVFERSTAPAIQRLIGELRSYFYLDPITFQRISNDINFWQKEHMRVVNTGSLLQIGRLTRPTLEQLILLHPTNFSNG